jgi:hypothetical protein
MRKKLWLGSLKTRDRSKNVDVDGRVVVKCILGKEGLRMWIGFVWLRIKYQCLAPVNTVMNLQIAQKAGVC